MGQGRWRPAPSRHRHSSFEGNGHGIAIPDHGRVDALVLIPLILATTAPPQTATPPSPQPEAAQTGAPPTDAGQTNVPPDGVAPPKPAPAKIALPQPAAASEAKLKLGGAIRGRYDLRFNDVGADGQRRTSQHLSFDTLLLTADYDSSVIFGSAQYRFYGGSFIYGRANG